jgi:hypothetical protein
MPNAIESLQNIPFSTLIGGPLIAAVQAQAQAAQTSITFIQAVGFEPAAPTPPGGTPAPRAVKNVSFQYEKTDEEGKSKKFNLTVPILAITPVPYLRVDELNIDFTAKLNDIVTSDVSTSHNWGVDFGGQAFWGWGTAYLRGSYSGSHNSTTKSSQSAEYTMNVKVRAVQAEVPGGLAKVLDIIEAVINEKPAS